MQVRVRVASLANSLYIRWNIGDNDVVCVFGPNHIGYGANPSYTSDELVYRIQTAKATALFVSPDSLKPGGGKTKLALLFFSSGRTGRPKAVMIPHYAVSANCVQMKQYAKTSDGNKPNTDKLHRAGDVALGVLPFYRLLSSRTSSFSYGITLAIVPRFNFENMLQSVERYQVAHSAFVPPMIVLLRKARLSHIPCTYLLMLSWGFLRQHLAVNNYDLDCVWMLTSGAAPLSPELTNQVAQVLNNSGIGQGYGMTETCITFSTCASARLGPRGASSPASPAASTRRTAPGAAWARRASWS
ncbi:hypothetical protein C8Q76DRAFT_802450 [Earliella scabrosa]|nr:hypothetical protein C8Q76DRAFT_802450 [Earliella scabrosa]